MPPPGCLKHGTHADARAVVVLAGYVTLNFHQHDARDVSAKGLFFEARSLPLPAPLWFHPWDGRPFPAQPRRRPCPPRRVRDPRGARPGVRDPAQDRPKPRHRGRPRGGGADRRGAARRHPRHPGRGGGGDRRRACAGRSPRVLAGGPAGRHAGVLGRAGRVHGEHRPGARRAGGAGRGGGTGVRRTVRRIGRGHAGRGRRARAGEPALRRRCPAGPRTGSCSAA